MPFMKLGEKDRERLGAPDVIAVDISGITNREAIRLRTAFGFNTPRQFARALRGRKVDADGNTLPADAVEFDDIERDYVAVTALIWLALRRSGVDADPTTLEFDMDAMEYVPDPDEAVDPEAVEAGKAEEPTEDPNSSTS